ncbi:MAG TPA: SDR family oxidoreductase, partial [Anaeromyxobacteraceae bacterium]
AIDHLVLTAVGDEYAVFGRLAELTHEQLERSLDKLRGFVNVTRAAAPLMRERGSITLLSGAGAVRPPLGTSFAAAANGAIVSFGKALALELAPLRVNVMMPGVVDTPLHGDRRVAIRAMAESPELPARRFGQPEDIAHAIVFLMTNPYVTGHTLVVDGGFLAA